MIPRMEDYPASPLPLSPALREGFEPSSSAFGKPRSSDRAVATSPRHHRHIHLQLPSLKIPEMIGKQQRQRQPVHTSLAMFLRGPDGIRTRNLLVLSESPLARLGYRTVSVR